ncbi:MAG: leucine--tRNA ligase [Acidobacteriota bacterium]
MSRPYDFETIEAKWQKRWLQSDAFEVHEDSHRPKYYCLEMLPYSSGKIHMGHVRNYSIGDVISRFRTMRGYNVLHPIGWDALGLPAENAALQHGAHPEDWTRSNIAQMKTQLQRMGFSYAWQREVATCDPEYYRWNQWFFIQMWKRGIAYRKKAGVNWCPDCQTVLANEQVEGGRCWRCGSEVVERDLEQWFLKITDYAEELLADMEQLGEWPERVLTMQRNWIGKSEGAEVDFSLEDEHAVEGKGLAKSIRVFTTRIDTIYGATFVLLAPEHPLAAAFAEGNGELKAFLDEAQSQAREARLSDEAEKTGMATGHHGVNPFTGEKVPIWVANYVLMEYGTGAVMAVPAHDQRDFEFARKYGLPVRVVIQPPEPTLRPDSLERAYTEYGTLVDSGDFTGLPSMEAIGAMTRHAEQGGFGKKTVSYRLRDWGISRQRYWGTPIPMIYCDRCGILPVPEEDLPILLPRDVRITGKGESALKENEAFVNTACPDCGGTARRETDTMDTFVDSSWYFYRYTDPGNVRQPFDPDVVKYWFPIDLYIGGVEHAILHLIYARFWTKVMRALGLVKFDEPVVKLLSQGMVLKDGSAMSKSRGNVVEPDEVIGRFGADTLRLYVLFEAPPEKEMDWTDQRLEGPARLLQRIWRFVDDEAEALREVESIEGGEAWQESEAELRRKTHQTILRVTRDIEERLHLNTAVSAVMELVNEIYKYRQSAGAKIGRAWSDAPENGKALREATETVVMLLAPFAPHIAEEMWEMLGHKRSLVRTEWPSCDPAVAAEETVTLVLQVNGKVRNRITIPADLDEEALRQRAMEDDKIRSLTSGKTVQRVVVVPRRLVNVVVEG